MKFYYLGDQSAETDFSFFSLADILRKQIKVEPGD